WRYLKSSSVPDLAIFVPFQTTPMGPLKPSVLFVHNKYLHKGGEDSVVHNEMEVLTRNDYTIHYLEFQNQQLSKAGFGAFS
ncbi:hypothetical protein ABTQ09_20445, partial [Acinetobacter baumannii]